MYSKEATSFAGSDGISNSSYPVFEDYRDQATSFAALAAYADALPVHLAKEGGRPERLTGGVVSGRYFELLGVRAQAGRLLAAADDAAPGREPVVVLSDRLWRRLFGADPRAVGTTVRLNGHAFTVVGVAPAGFYGVSLDSLPQLWVTTSMAPVALPEFGGAGMLTDRSFSWLDMVGRLKPGVSMAAAQAELDTIAARRAASQTGRDKDPFAKLLAARDAVVDPYESRSGAAALVAPARRRLSRAADRVRRHRLSPARARREAARGDRDPPRDRRLARPARPAAPRREPAARRPRRRRGRRGRVLDGDPAALRDSRRVPDPDGGRGRRRPARARVRGRVGSRRRRRVRPRSRAAGLGHRPRPRAEARAGRARPLRPHAAAGGVRGRAGGARRRPPRGRAPPRPEPLAREPRGRRLPGRGRVGGARRPRPSGVRRGARPALLDGPRRAAPRDAGDPRRGARPHRAGAGRGHAHLALAGGLHAAARPARQRRLRPRRARLLRGPRRAARARPRLPADGREGRAARRGRQRGRGRPLLARPGRGRQAHPRRRSRRPAARGRGRRAHGEESRAARAARRRPSTCRCRRPTWAG